MRSRFRADVGSITAEFALALPAVVAMLALCLCAVQVAGQHLRLQDAAAAAARAEARGGTAAIVARLVPAASAHSWSDADLTCVTLTSPSALPGLMLTASSCALGGGE